ncbi:MAG: dephospho-CoA kinase [Betaproteobacteria bacterium]|nr:dephospho-CoA kinase [Betaproteobacteria bacterium]
MKTPSAPWVAGLTGGIGSGKSTAAHALAQCGSVVIDTDALSRALTGPGGAAMNAIRAAFGDQAIQPDGSMDRARIRNLVLSDPAARRQLEGVLHPLIRLEVQAALCAAPPGSMCVIEIPLLFETMGYRDLLDWVVALDCPVSLQTQRVRARSGLAAAQIDALLAAQVPRGVRLQLADEVLVNSASPEALSLSVRAMHARWAGMATAPT